jgi:uncharacterized protein (TIGR04255 family)
MPTIRPLPNKPLIEAILELRWHVSRGKGDPHYTILVGRLYDRIKNQYPFHESLPSADIPAQIAENLVQHRFRSGKGQWPLVQIGPGIITLNDTDGYIWQDFGQRATSLVQAVFEAYPEPQQLRVSNLVLRYMDAFELQSIDTILNYLSDKLKSTFTLPSQLFDDTTAVSPTPRSLNILISYPTNRPKGDIRVRFASGKHKDKPALIMETAVRSEDTDLPSMPQGFKNWSKNAHRLTDDWFFKFIEGELEEKFVSG